MIKLLGYKKCGTCRKAEKTLNSIKLKFNYIDVTENPPSAISLKKFAKQANLELKKLFNTSGVQYRELKIKDKLANMTDKDIADLLASNGRLIKRPIVTDGTKTSVGFKESEFKKLWKLQSSIK